MNGARRPERLEGLGKWLPFLSPSPLVARVRPHLAQRADEQDGGEQVFADDRDALPAGRRARLTGTSPEHLPALALEADEVRVLLRLVSDLVHVRLVAAHAHLLFADPLGGLGELLGSLYLNHGRLPFSLRCPNLKRILHPL